jgi:hypothetical protein
VTVSAWAAVLSAVLDLAMGVMYCAQIVRGRTRPRLATWVIFEIGVGMSLVTYMSSHDHSLLKAALNVTDAVMVTAIIAALLAKGRGQRMVFTRNEQLSLLMACLTLVLWGVTRTAWVGFVGFQVVMSVAYVPTVESLWHRHPGPAPEQARAWSVNALAALMGMVVDVTGAHHDYLAMLYPLRAFVLCLVVVGLVWRWKRQGIEDKG